MYIHIHLYMRNISSLIDVFQNYNLVMLYLKNMKLGKTMEKKR